MIEKRSEMTIEEKTVELTEFVDRVNLNKASKCEEGKLEMKKRRCMSKREIREKMTNEAKIEKKEKDRKYVQVKREREDFKMKHSVEEMRRMQRKRVCEIFYIEDKRKAYARMKELRRTRTREENFYMKPSSINHVVKRTIKK